MQNKRSEPRLGAENRRLTVFASFAVSALFGALFGALCCCYTDSSLSEVLKNAEEICLNVRRSGDLSKIILSSLAGTGFYLLIAFMLGFSALSQPFEFILPFLRGMGGGVVLTQLYGESFSKQTLLRVAAFFPGIFISLVVIIFAAREAFYMSSRLFSVCFHNRIFDGLFGSVKEFTVHFVVLFAVTSATAMLDSALAMLLLGKI